MAMTVITTSSSIKVKPWCAVRRARWLPLSNDHTPCIGSNRVPRTAYLFGDTQHLLGRRDPGLYFPPPVLPQRRHALRLSDLADGARVRTLQQRPLDVVRRDEELKQARA